MRKINASFLNIPKILVKSQINKEFFKRRYGEKLIVNYKMFLKKCYKNKLLSKYSILLNYLMRILAYKMPLWHFANFIKIFLRF